MLTVPQHVVRLMATGKLRPFIMFDKDGTLTGCTVKGRPPNTLEEQYMLPNVVEVCSLLKKLNYTLAIASNQGGVAYGFMSHVHACRLVIAAAKAIGASSWDICPHHPSGTVKEYAKECDCRKPKPGMIHALRGGVPVSKILYVGDWESDQQAAASAGCEFVWAEEFFGWQANIKEAE